MSNNLFSWFRHIISRIGLLARGKLFQRAVFFGLMLLGVAALWYLSTQIEPASIGAVLRSLRLWQLGAIVGFVFVTLLISALRWRTILLGFGYRESIWKLMKRVTKASAVSFVVPSFEISSETFKGLELQRHGVSPAASFASVFFDFIIILIINTAGGLLVLTHVLFQGLLRAELAFAGACVILIAFFLFLKKIFKQGTLSRFLAQCIPLNEKNAEAVQMFDYGLSFFVKESRKYLIGAGLITVLGFVWEIAQVFLVLTFLGVAPDMTQVFVFYLAIYFFNGVPAFGGLGFGEAGAFLSGSFLGVPDHISLSLALILRLRQVIMLASGGSFFMVTAVKEAVARLRS